MTDKRAGKHARFIDLEVQEGTERGWGIGKFSRQQMMSIPAKKMNFRFALMAFKIQTIIK